MEARPGASTVDDAQLGTLRTIVIERVGPELDGGRHPVKRVVGDRFTVSADIFAEGHGLLDAALLVRADNERVWHEEPMRLVDDDRWSATVTLTTNRRHRYTIEAWRDEFGSWREAFEKNLAAGHPVTADLEEGRLVVEAAAARAASGDLEPIPEMLRRLAAATDDPARAAILLRSDLLDAMRRNPDRSDATRYDRELEVVVDREAARFAAWYELFPRSQGRSLGQATTFRGAEWRLPEIAGLGFDVVYVPPIHPIGDSNRKGRNNALTATPGDPGSPYAIGSVAGGFTAVAPELGGLEEFAHFREAVEAHGMELAIDLALQVSPDHPWVREHPEWFRHAPDGSIKYAENPPKKYQDIYPLDFHAADPSDRAALWRAVLDVVRFWIGQGVRTFRVDNPHTKPVPFWEWLIREVHVEHPDVILLSEAFTRPKMMRMLAKIGFTQSYTYFTWRDQRDELREYMEELTGSEMREYFRGNLFTNTPDINPHHLDAGRPAFVTRYVLAATLSSLYGMYSGFELCENARLDDREEYLDSEKYEIRTRDWDAPGNIKPLIAAVNGLRRAHPALQLYDNLRFQPVTGERTLFYRKAIPADDGAWTDAIFVAVNCDPLAAEHAVLHPVLPEIGIGWDDPYTLTDLITGESRTEWGADLAVELAPDAEPFRIFGIARRA
ncbi:MAG: alpha-1,4-glucan--maltose-1-phosphate maltosyltransferase [Candidatus Limnocylindria bacterium]